MVEAQTYVDLGPDLLKHHLAATVGRPVTNLVVGSTMGDLVYVSFTRQ